MKAAKAKRTKPAGKFKPLSDGYMLRWELLRQQWWESMRILREGNDPEKLKCYCASR